MPRPLSITRFGRLYLSSTFLGLLFTVLYYDTLREWSLQRGSSPGAILVFAFVGTLISLLLWYLIARRASRVAKWLVTIGTGFELVLIIGNVGAYLVFGAAYLAIVCLIPEILISYASVPFYFGGTSLLIVVSVTMDTVAQVQGYLLAHQYEGLIKRSKLRGRRR